MITIIDYGLGNISAFANVYKRLNIPCTVARYAADLENAKKLVLPGVGAFDHAMTLLQRSGMREKLDELVLEKKVPVLGICVGMQMLANVSEEGRLAGLGWISGEVKRIDDTSLTHKTKLPHMGWNKILLKKHCGLFDRIETGARFYFLHSYFFSCQNGDDCIADTEYGNMFTCAVNRENIFGVQFHPEKSHHNGVQLLKNFGELNVC